MKKLLRNNCGSALVDFALVILPVMVFIIGIVQVAWIIWACNMLQSSVEAAARCGAVQSTTFPCNGSDMVTAANRVFSPLTGATFSTNSGTCAADGGQGLIGTYTVSILVTSLTLTAKSCYPTVS
jgi:Flp pilus assembly protein TadG